MPDIKPNLLNDCEREAIHIPGSIQPHGALLAYESAAASVLYGSHNLARWLPVGALPVRGRALLDLLGETAFANLEQALAGRASGAVRHQMVELPARPQQGQAEPLIALVHVYRGVRIAEFVPAVPAERECDWMQRFNDALESLHSARDLGDLIERIAHRVKQLTALDRVMIYRFDENQHGHVIADVHEPQMESFFDLHYPASDIPAQARELYRLQGVRYIADVEAQPIAVEPWLDSARRQPLDMSCAMLRSPSPVHLRYLHNMGVRSTLTISLLVDGRLWGLIACHHRSASALPVRLQRGCSTLAINLGFMIGWHVQREQAGAAVGVAEAQAEVVDAFNHVQSPLPDVIEQSAAALLRIGGATGGAFWRDETVLPFGQWPDGARGESIIRAVRQAFEASSEQQLDTEQALLQPPLSPGELHTVCGFMALQLEAFAGAGLVWIRPENRHVFAWGGDPTKPMLQDVDEHGRTVLSPRASFARWETFIEGRCRPWSDVDRNGARALLPLRELLVVRDSLAQVTLSDRQFRSLVALQSDTYWECDLEGHLVALSKPLPTDHGPIVGQTLLDLFTPCCTPLELQELRQALRSPRSFRALHVRGRIAEGRGEFEVLLNGEPIRDQYGNAAGWHGTASDITHEAALQVALRQRDVEQQAMLDNDLIGIAKLKDRIMIWTNRGMERIFGYASGALHGQSTRILYPDDSGFVAVGAERDSAQAAGHSFRGQHAMVRHDGEARWIDLSGVPLSADGAEWMWLVQDITERKREEELLRKSRGFLDRTGQLAGVGGWEIDVATAQLIWSDETCRIHGVEPGYQPTIEQAIAFYVPEARSSIRAAVETAMAGGAGFDRELQLICLGGERIWVRAVGSVEFEGDKPLRVVGAMQDVTARVQERQALEEANERMALAAKSAQIGNFDWNVVTGVLKWDAWAYRLAGLEPSETAGSYELWANALHPEDRVAAELAAHEALYGDVPFNTEFRFLWPDGSVHHMRGAGHVTRDSGGNPLRMVGLNWDVTEMRQLALQLAEQHETMRVTLQSIGDAVITTDTTGHVAWLNPRAERMTGWLTAEAKGRQLAQVFRTVDENTREPLLSPGAAELLESESDKAAQHVVLIARDGTECGIEDSAAPIRSDTGEMLGLVLVFHDVSEQRRISGEMTFRATHDALTGLYNRVEFESRLERVLRLAHEEPSEHSLLYIDLDEFKLVNDACGHAIGDQFLQQMATILLDMVRSSDIVARLGGDEFAIILEHCSAEHARRVAQKICDHMDQFRFIYEARRFRVGASIGLVAIDQRWETTEALRQAADSSCYAAKESGRNRVHAWLDTDVEMRARETQTLWTSRIQRALDEDRFVLFAQRIVALNEPGPALNAEVLLRMTNDDGTLAQPGAFLPSAERFHLITRVDQWVLRHVCAWMIAAPSLDQIASLSVNLSGQSVGDRAFHRWATELLAAVGPMICNKLCLEITETAAVSNLADAAAFINQVRTMGVKVALDDFGAGASSFRYLKNLPVDFLKIDGQFIRDVVSDPLSEAAVRCFVSVARAVGVKTVAEFVDRALVLERLREIGVDYAQGYLLHRPAPLHELIASGESSLAVALDAPSTDSGGARSGNVTPIRPLVRSV
jgi:diguanylate cyclase (GGDEF)-like protein/PAS domain S-box-containing protein